MIECFSCDGTGQVDAFFLRHADGHTEPHRRISCERCKGTGVIPDEMLGWMHAGRKRREERLSRNMTLREESKRLGISPVELSKIESGKVAPPESCVDDERPSDDGASG